MDISDVTNLEIDDGEYLCTYKTKTFFVKKTPSGMKDGWLISEEQRDGSLKAIEGVHKSVEDAMAYYKEMVLRGKKQKERVTKRKGGVALPKDWGWKVGDRLVADINGRFYIGTVSNMFGFSDSMFVKFDSEIENDDGSIAWTFGKDDPRIVGIGVDKINPKPIPAKNINSWLVSKTKKKAEPYSFILLPDLQRDMQSENPEITRLMYLNFINSLKRNIKTKFLFRVIDEYLSTHIVSFYKGSGDSMSETVEGIYWNQRNEVSLKWSHIENADSEAALVVIHEVIHYKLWPVRTKLKNFLKKNICDILDLDIDEPSVEKWLKLFIDKNKKLNVSRIRKLLRYTGWEREDFDTLYGLTHFYELPSVVFSFIGSGKPTCKGYEKAYKILYAKFKNQLLK